MKSFEVFGIEIITSSIILIKIELYFWFIWDYLHIGIEITYFNYKNLQYFRY